MIDWIARRVRIESCEFLLGMGGISLLSLSLILSFTIIALIPFGFSAHMELYLPHHTEHPYKKGPMIFLISKSLMKLWN